MRGRIGHAQRRPWRPVAVAVLLAFPLTSLAANPVVASPVLTDPNLVATPFDGSNDEAVFGERIDMVDAGVLVHGRRGFDTNTATLMINGDEGRTATTTIEASGFIAGGRNTVIAIDHDGDDATIRRYAVADQKLKLVQEISMPNVGPDYGNEIAVSDKAVVISRPNGPGTDVIDQEADEEPPADEVDIFVPGIDSHFWLAQTLQPQLSHLHLAIAGDGTTIAVSGSEYFASDGNLRVFYRTPDSDEWESGPTIENIGGGAVVSDSSDIFVQRNGYFPRLSEVWTVVSQGDDGLTQVGIIPAFGSALAVDSTAIALGNPTAGRVMLFERQPTDAGSFRFLQAITPDSPSSNRFGSSIAFDRGSVLIGVPALWSGGIANAGGLHNYIISDGPVGCTIVGTSGDDVIVGTKQRDVICGLAGNDEITGLSGNDIIYGGPGDDIIEGNTGRDLIFGGPGYDQLRGGAQDDIIYGEGGVDEIFGGDGSDRLYGGDDIDIIKGGGGDDFIYGESGNDQLFGEEDNDFLDGGPGADLVRGGDDEDTLHGGSGNDLLFAGQGDDVLSGGLGYDDADGGHDTDWCDKSVELCRRASWENHESVEDATGRD